MATESFDNTKSVIVVMLLFIMFVVAVAGVYVWQQAKLDDLNRKNQDLTTKLQKLEVK